MLRAAKATDLLQSKILEPLSLALSPSGFKYKKSTKQILRQQGEFTHQISADSSPSLYYNEETGKLYLTFRLYASILIPEYYKWLTQNEGTATIFHHNIQSISARKEISFDDFKNTDFYTPTPAAEFKHLISQEQAIPDQHIVEWNELLTTSLPAILQKFTIYSGFRKIYDELQDEYKDPFLLVYGKQTDHVDEFLENRYQFLVANIKNFTGSDTSELIDRKAYFETFIHQALTLAQKQFINPYAASIKVLADQKEAITITSQINFQEALRLDISQYKIISTSVSKSMEILLANNESTLFKLKAQGQTVLTHKVKAHAQRTSSNPMLTTGYIAATDEFYSYNVIVRPDNTILELQLPVENKSKKGDSPFIADFSYSPQQDSYVLLYAGNLLFYSRIGELTQTINITSNAYGKIIPEHNWVLITEKEKQQVLFDFSGKEIARIDIAKGNTTIAVSAAADKIALFGYSTKSELYDIPSCKKQTLWAHPTFLKDYKEVLYNDVEHNFGMDIAKFSPDGSYLVGGAYHGKYVAWKLPKLERVELIPLQELVDILPPRVATSYHEGSSTDIVVKAEIIDLHGQLFLKNRGSGVSQIFFIEQGDFFITHLGNSFLLVWDRSFTNLSYQKLEGRLTFHHDVFFACRTSSELTIYRKQD